MPALSLENDLAISMAPDCNGLSAVMSFFFGLTLVAIALLVHESYLWSKERRECMAEVAGPKAKLWYADI
jgi:hypothetical protein